MLVFGMMMTMIVENITNKFTKTKGLFYKGKTALLFDFNFCRTPLKVLTEGKTNRLQICRALAHWFAKG